MLKEIKQIVGRIAPPAAIFVALSSMIFLRPNSTIHNWPFFGEFVMDSALKAIMIAVVFFLLCLGWAILKRASPRLYYSSETIKATKKARKLASSAEERMTYFNRDGSIDVKEESIKHAGIASMLQSQEVSKLFRDSMNSLLLDKNDHHDKLDKFYEKTKWVTKK